MKYILIYSEKVLQKSLISIKKKANLPCFDSVFRTGGEQQSYTIALNAL